MLDRLEEELTETPTSSQRDEENSSDNQLCAMFATDVDAVGESKPAFAC